MKRPLWLTGVWGIVVAGVWLMAGLGVGAQAQGRPPLTTPTAAPRRESLSAIRLAAPGAPATAWTVMQWQDALGGWHDVEGWRGEFDADGYKTWRFPEQHFGTGPFRWQVFAKRDGALWAVSAPFDLPDGRDQTLAITATPR